MSYERVIPRDLFNEAKLLKCIGRICLMIHEGKCLLKCNHIHPSRGFDIHQDPNSGDIYVLNLQFKNQHGMYVGLLTSLNAHSPYPLILRMPGDAEYPALDDDGELTEEFLYCAYQSPAEWASCGNKSNGVG